MILNYEIKQRFASLLFALADLAQRLQLIQSTNKGKQMRKQSLRFLLAPPFHFFSFFLFSFCLFFFFYPVVALGLDWETFQAESNQLMN